MNNNYEDSQENGHGDTAVYQWDQKVHSTKVRLSDDHTIATRKASKQTTDGVRGAKGFQQGVHHFRFVFNEKPWGSHCSVGLCTDGAVMQKPGYDHVYGMDALSWAWDAPSRKLLHDAQAVGTLGMGQELPKALDMILDIDQGTLSFTCCLFDKPQEAFTGLPKGRLFYPVASMVFGSAKVMIKLLSSDELDAASPTPSSESQSSSLKGSRASVKSDKDSEPVVGVFLTQGVPESEKTSSNDLEENDARKETSSSASNTNITGEETPSGISDRNEADDETPSIEGDTNMGNKNSHQKEGEVPTDERKKKIFEDEDSKTKYEAQNCITDEDANVTDKEAKTESPTAQQNDEDDVNESELSDELQENNRTQSANVQFNDLEELESKHENDELQNNNNNEEMKPGNKIESDKSKVDSMSDTQSMKDGLLEDKDMNDSGKNSDTEDSAKYTPDSNEKTCDNNNDDGNVDNNKPLETETDIENEEAKEPVEIVEMNKFETQERYLVNLAHMWDFTLKGGCIRPYPNVPFICVPDLHFGERVQGLRGHTGFCKGIHTWKLTELRTFHPHVDTEDAKHAPGDANHLLIGIVAEQYRAFNFGLTSDAKLGANAWCWDVHDNVLFCNGTRIAEPCNEYHGTCNIDMKDGLEVTLDLVQHRLSFSVGGRKLDMEDINISGNEFFPFLMFKQKATFPVKFEYTSGPRDYIEYLINYLTHLDKKHLADLFSFKSLQRQPSFRYDMVNMNGFKGYRWGEHSEGIKLTHSGTRAEVCRNVGENSAELVLSEVAMKGNRHVVEIRVKDIKHLIIGIAGDEEHLNSNSIKEYQMVRESPEIVLGDSLTSWAWDVKNRTLCHAGHVLGTYPPPSKVAETDATQGYCLRLTVDFSFLTASFALIPDQGEPLDLGVAFINFLPKLDIVAAILDAEAGATVEMEYISGPEAFVKELSQTSSKVCVIL